MASVARRFGARRVVRIPCTMKERPLFSQRRDHGDGLRGGVDEDSFWQRARVPEKIC